MNIYTCFLGAVPYSSTKTRCFSGLHADSNILAQLSRFLTRNFKKCYIRYSTALQLGTGHWATDQNPYIYLYRTAIPGTACRKLKVLLSMIYSQPIIQYIFFGPANRCPASESKAVCVRVHTHSSLY